MMKTRRLTIDVLYDDADEQSVQIILDKMTTDWLTDKDAIKGFEEHLSAPTEPDIANWDYFWQFDEESQEWVQVND